MPSNPHESALGKFTIDLGDKTWQKRVQTVELRSDVDQPAFCSVITSVPPADVGKLSLSSMPKSLKLSVDGRSLFQGELVSVGSTTSSAITLVYADALYKARKIHDNTYLKDQPLRSVLETLVKSLGVSPSFQGDFGEKLPALNLSGKSLMEHLTELSYQYGFFFLYCASRNALSFVRVGSSLSSLKISGKEMTSLQLEQTHNAFYDKISLEYFDAQTLETKSQSLSNSQVYGPVDSFSGHASFRTKKDWGVAKGEVEGHVNDENHFQESEKILKNQLSKSVMRQERFRGVSFQVFPSAGDKVSVKEAPIASLQDGDYFVESCAVRIGSAIPRAEFTLIRP